MKYTIGLSSLLLTSISVANAQEINSDTQDAKTVSTELTNGELEIADNIEVPVADNSDNVAIEAEFTGVPLEDYSVPIRSFTAEEIAAVPYPKMDFSETESDIKDYDKYFFFHRDNTSFEQAFTDISECDDLAVGITRYSPTAVYSPNLIGGAIGNVLGNLLVDALFAGPERKRTRRMSIRNCMAFKGYNRYGTTKVIYNEFEYLKKNKADISKLSEGAKKKARKETKEKRRESILFSQAKIASGPTPTAEVLPK